MFNELARAGITYSQDDPQRLIRIYNKSLTLVCADDAACCMSFERCFGLALSVQVRVVCSRDDGPQRLKLAALPRSACCIPRLLEALHFESAE